MRKTARVLIIFLLFAALRMAAAPLQSADDKFRQAMDAVAAKDYATALSALEQLVSADPDNLRYGSEYRQAAIQAKQFDRSINFFQKLTEDHPTSGHAFLNFAFAYVDKIPSGGSITQVILADNALNAFSKAIELQPEWIAFYSRGNAYLFWPKVFKRAPLGVADLKRALQMQKRGPKRPHYVRTYIALGDGYWKIDKLSRARATWREGLKQFPGNQQLASRLALRGEQLKAAIDDALDPSKRVDTSLRELWTEQ